MAKRCPACNLVNPDAAEVCDCGRSFVDGSLGKALERRLERPLDRPRRVRTNAIALFGASSLAGILARLLVDPFIPIGFAIACVLVAVGLATAGVVNLIRWRRAVEEG